MTLQRALGLALTTASALIVAYMSGSWPLPLLVCAACAASWAVPLSFEVSTRKRVVAALLLGVLFILKLRLAPGVVRDSVILTGGRGFAFAQYLLVLQAALFFVKQGAGETVRLVRTPSREPLSPVLAAFAVVATGLAGDVYLRGREVRLYEGLAAGMVLLVSVFLSASTKRTGHASRRLPRYGLMLLVLVAALGLSNGLSDLLLRFRYELDQAVMAPFAGFFTQSSVGFSGGGQLGSMAAQKSTESKEVALRIVAEHQPGYLRGKAFSEYVGSRWNTAQGLRTLPRVKAPAGVPAVREADRFYRLRTGTEGPWESIEVWPETMRAACFSRLDGQYFKCAVDALQVDVEDVPHADGLPRYAVYVGGSVSPEPLFDAQRYTSVPAGLDAGITELARSLFKDCHDRRDKMRAVEAYFHDHYRYTLGVSVPPGQDPLTWFLLERPAAHCEYFASGAALLLRLGGVPCRYVTGFVASEWNAAGGYWVARNRDAHAWVEAHDGEQWVIVEATPADGVPEPEASAAIAQWWDTLTFRFRELSVALVEGGAQGLARWMADRLTGLFAGRMSGPASLVIVVLLALAVSVKVRRVLVRRGRVDEPELRRWHKLLRKADREAVRLGYVRAPGETLHAFARRISQEPGAAAREQSIAAWYIEYARIRYGGDGGEDGLASLRDKLTQRRR